MRILVLSDLHLEFGARYEVPPQAAFDVVVLAGDICKPGEEAIRWAADPATFGGKPVLFVAGNHEYYGGVMSSELAAMRAAAEGSAVHVLSKDSVVIGGVRFMGTTLWTDFALGVSNKGGPVSEHTETDVGRALAHANRYLNDFRCIELLAPTLEDDHESVVLRLLTAEDTLAMHWVERDWLRRELELAPSGPIVVITHHGPHHRSVDPKYDADWLTPAFISDLPESFFEGVPMWLAGRKEMVGAPALWIHGHTHSSFDYQVGACRLVANPRGYPLRGAAFENSEFDPAFIVEVPMPHATDINGQSASPARSGGVATEGGEQ